MFHYYQRQGNVAAAQAVLADFRQSKEARQAAWTATELRTLAQLYRGLNNHNETARYFYALYSLPGADASAREQASGGLDRVVAVGSRPADSVWARATFRSIAISPRWTIIPGCSTASCRCC